MSSTVRIGTSGWQYGDWRRVLYPEGLGVARWLEHYAQHFDTVEVNATFYRLAREAAVARWAQTVPPGFAFAVKGSRYITHRLKLRDAAPAVERFFAPLRPLGDRLAVVLWQLPPRWRRDVDRLDRFLGGLPVDHRYAVEFRDPDWFHDDVYEILRAHGAACVWTSSELARSVEPVVTGGFVYVRFHGLGDEPAAYRYGREALEPWADRLRAAVEDGTPAWVYFNNDVGGAAIHDARTLSDLLPAS